jgi:hypothetical protein
VRRTRPSSAANECDFQVKVQFALKANASAIIVVNDWAGAPPWMSMSAPSAGDPLDDPSIQPQGIGVPVCMVHQHVESLIKSPGLLMSFEGYRSVKTCVCVCLKCARMASSVCICL